MPRKPFFLVTVVCFIIGLQVSAMAAAAKPNIIVVLCDDMGYECLSCYGSTSYKTPNLDALAASGIRFKNAYATPLCSPSRVELMTGRYGFRTSWVNLIGRGGEEANDYFDPTKEKTFGNVLKSAGYVTALAGKWQLANFPDHPHHVKECGFDEYCCWAWSLNGKQTSRYWDPGVWQNGKLRDDTAGKYGEDMFSSFLTEFVGRHKDQPFFVYYPMVLVHAPFTPTPDSASAKDSKKNGKKGKEKKDRKDKSEQGEALFPDMVAYMDKKVGSLVATLDKLHLRENTLVIFTGDNGTDHRIYSKLGGMTIQGGKGSMTEFGTHVPFIASWPGTIKAGQVKDDLLDFSDVLPTVAEIGGAKLPAGVTIDGKSFAAQLRGEKGKHREWIFTQLGHNQLVRDSRFMLHSDGRIYDIAKDPFEKNDLQKSDDAAVVASKNSLQAVLNRMK